MDYLCHPLGDFCQNPNYYIHTYYTYYPSEWNHQNGKLDIPCPENTKFYSMTNGVVKSIWTDSKGVTGLEILTSDTGISKVTGQSIVIRYLHWKSINVDVNDTISIGQELGLTGDEGSQGSFHLHIDMYWGDMDASDAGAVQMSRFENDILPYYNYHQRENETIIDYHGNAPHPLGSYYLYHIFTSDILKTSAVSGNTNAERIWNWFKNANIPNVSNRPELIAGIIGNCQQESYEAIDVLGNNGTYYGPWCESNIGFRNYITNAGFTFHPYTSSPGNDSDAIPYAFQWLTQQSDSWVNWLANVIDQVSSQTGEAGARAYAELFCVCVERCVGGEIAVQDPGVRQIMLDYYGGTSYLYQDLDRRRNNAAAIYNQFA